MTVMAKKIHVAYSYAVNFNANLANSGERKISATTLMMPPIKDTRMAVPMALPPSPRSAMGPPSNTVTMEEGVPGIFSRMALISPPEMAPIYSAQ